MVSNGNIFETSWYMRGFEQMLMDVMCDEDLVHALMGRVTTSTRAFCQPDPRSGAGRDRPGVHRGRHWRSARLLMPYERWERMLKPYHRRMNDAIHQRGARVIYHTMAPSWTPWAGWWKM